MVLLSAVLAFCAGYAIRSGSICLVMAARMLVVQGKPARMWAFGFAAVAAGAVILPLAWVVPSQVTLAPGLQVTFMVVFGAVVFGLGARLNNGCVFGTLGQLTGGRMQYLFTVVGLIVGAVATEAMATPQRHAVRSSILGEPGILSVPFWLCLLAVCLGVLYTRIGPWIRDIRHPRVTRFGPFRAMLVVGVCGGLLYSFQSDWGYSSRLSALVAGQLSWTSSNSAVHMNTAAVMLVVGGIVSAYRTSSFRLYRPNLREVANCSVGGALMGSAAALIPGGNSALLVYGMPSFSLHAVVGYVVMTAILLLSFAIQRLTASLR